MSSKDTAYMTANPEVIEAYEKWKADRLAVMRKRVALVDAVGREMWINGTGYSTRVVGFDRFDSDEDGDTLHHDGCLIVSKRTGPHQGRVVPNLKRKSGKRFAEELREYTTGNLTLPGLPGMHIYFAGGGMVMGHANVWLLSETLAVDFGSDGPQVFALWGCDDAPMDPAIWTQIPLSTYYLAREAYDADAATQAEVSGNEESA